LTGHIHGLLLGGIAAAFLTAGSRPSTTVLAHELRKTDSFSILRPINQFLTAFFKFRGTGLGDDLQDLKPIGGLDLPGEGLAQTDLGIGDKPGVGLSEPGEEFAPFGSFSGWRQSDSVGYHSR
jgi:hypothetical protein